MFLRTLHYKIQLIVMIIQSAVLVASNEAPQCTLPLGMESGAIKNEDITASSSFDSSNVGPHHARVRTELNGGAWCPQNPATAEPDEWLQIDLHDVHLISSVGTQGRFGNGQGVEFSEAYMLEYWRPRLSKWIRYRSDTGEEILNGNINTYLESKTALNPPIFANKIRFLPYSYHTRTVCMRVELYGCRWSDGIISYSMQQGDKRGPNWEFYDSSYDGYWDGGKLKNGLGSLIDGRVGQDDFKHSFYDRSQNWVGWRNDTRENNHIDIIFEFDRIREFNTVNIFCNNQFSKDIQVFSKALIMFSIGGKYYKGEPITFDYIEDRIFEKARNVSIKLHHRIGKYVNLKLYFAAHWILVSEIKFTSNVLEGNFTEEDEEFRTQILQKYDTNVSNTINSKHQIVPINSSESNTSQYLGITAGLLSVLAVIIVTIIVYVVIHMRRQKSSPNRAQIQNSNEKTALYNEPSVRFPLNTSYLDVRDPEYAVPLPQHSTCTNPQVQELFSKPPPIPPVPEKYYAAAQICNSRFVPPMPPLSTPPSIRINRQPRYVSTANTFVGP